MYSFLKQGVGPWGDKISAANILPQSWVHYQKWFLVREKKKVSGERWEETDSFEIRNSRASREGMCLETRSEDSLAHWLHAMAKGDLMILATSTKAMKVLWGLCFPHTASFSPSFPPV